MVPEEIKRRYAAGERQIEVSPDVFKAYSESLFMWRLESGLGVGRFFERAPMMPYKDAKITMK